MLELLKKDTVCVWNELLEKAFQGVKERLTYYDPENPITISADASRYELGCTISQEENKRLRVIAYASHKLAKTERNYANRKRMFNERIGLCEV